MILIGIDTGVHTGVAVWDTRRRAFLEIQTMKIHQALKYVKDLCERQTEPVMVIFEDARQRRWIPDSKNVRKEMSRRLGAGSIKRDAVIWQDFLDDYKIPYEAKPPRKGATKIDADYFKRLTGYTARTSEHARDAAMIIYGK